jgi:hypothetical protein
MQDSDTDVFAYWSVAMLFQSLLLIQSSPSPRKAMKRSSKQTPRGRDTPKKTNTAGKKVNALARYSEEKKEKKEMPVAHKNTKIMSKNNVLSMSKTPTVDIRSTNYEENSHIYFQENTTDVRSA